MKETYLHNGETLLAGKPLFLPTEQVTVVMQCLTNEQIAAIPADWFSVEVIGEEELVGSGDIIRRVRDYPSDCEVGIVISGGSAIEGLTEDMLKTQVYDERSIKPIDLELTATEKHEDRSCEESASMVEINAGACGSRDLDDDYINAGYDEEERFVVVVELLKEAMSIMNDLRTNRRESIVRSGSGSATTPNRGIFSPAIDENLLSNSVLSVKNQFLGNNVTFIRNGKTYKVMDFCFLTLLVLKRMGIIANSLRKPYCEFLQEKVFMAKTPNVRSFNNCANQKTHKEIEELLPKLKFGFLTKTPPDKSRNELYLICHEIGKAFHETDYFKKLRMQKNCLNDFIL